VAIKKARIGSARMISADNQIRIWRIRGEKVTMDQFFGDFVRLHPIRDDLLHGVNDLIPPTIIPGHVQH
jgi:hypothetical protein